MEFLPEQFDPWAENYDNDVEAESGFPFTGYAHLISSMVELAHLKPGELVLDLGCGTGNLGAAFLTKGCSVWASDFSSRMIDKARNKYPSIQFAMADVRDPLPSGFPEKYDVIVSAYVFHHFPISVKIEQILRYWNKHLNPVGRLIIGDLMFTSNSEMQKVASQYSDSWEEEFYWVLDQDLPLTKKSNLNPHYQQISLCAGLLAFEL